MHLLPAGNSDLGYLTVRADKSKNSRARHVPITGRVASMLRRRASRRPEVRWYATSGSDARSSTQRSPEAAEDALGVCVTLMQTYLRDPSWRSRSGRLYNHALDGSQQRYDLAEICPSNTGGNSESGSKHDGAGATSQGVRGLLGLAAVTTAPGRTIFE